MTWYAIDAVDRAFSRTKKALFEPFDFWKWVKIAIIIFFVGGMGSNYGGSGTNYQPTYDNYGDDFPVIDPGDMPYLPSEISGLGYTDSVSTLAIIATLIIFFVLFILIFSYVSSTMEFVFVESLVKNEVHLRSYFRKFMRKGFYLLLIRLALGLVFVVLFLLALLPFVPIIPIFLTESPDIAVPSLVGGFLWIFGVIILLALIGAVINSFISLSIPVSIYRETGILSAFRMVYRNFRKSWQEILVYWFIRFALGIGITILAIILLGLLTFGLIIVFLIIDALLYFLFSMIVSEPLIWILLIIFVLAELLFIFAILLLLSVPLEVFMKYHLLSFLEIWFADAGIPFFDKPLAVPETEPGTMLGTDLGKPEQYSSENSVLEQSESDLPGSGSGDSGGSGSSGTSASSESRVTHDF